MTSQETEKTTLGQAFAAELKFEAISTRKMLERVPEAKFDWSPHEKSMTLRRLATHVAEISNWTKPTLTQDELDFATSDYKPTVVNTAKELVEIFDKSVAESVELLEEIFDEDMMKTWCLRKGDEKIYEQPKFAIVRSMVLNHLYHHRGQLSVYLRLLGMPLSPVYGPTADEQNF